MQFQKIENAQIQQNENHNLQKTRIFSILIFFVF